MNQHDKLVVLYVEPLEEMSSDSIDPVVPINSAVFKPKRLIDRPKTRVKREPQRNCVICEAPAFCKHFNAISCESCAAFFRRTVSCRHRYTCTHNKTCDITESNGRTLCKFCRFKSCIIKGMNIGAVESCSRFRRFPNLSDESLLWRVVVAQRSTYLSRYQSLIRSYGGNQAITKMGVENPTCLHISIAVASEVPVLLDYLKATGFKEIAEHEDEFQQLSKALFYPWLCFTVVMHNLRNSGHIRNVAFVVDESFIKVNWETVGLMISSCHGLKNCQTVLDYTMRYYKTCLEMAARLHSLRFEDVEHSVIFHIFALQLTSKILKNNPSVRSQLSDVFEQLRAYYIANLDNVAVRLGNVVLILSQMEHLVTAFKDYAMILELNGHVPVVARTLGCSVQLAELLGEFQLNKNP
ncbi:Nuclear receptor domain-containing protein [Aphelenchoides besseyi]|nr:Nuclear receptor domain-containing protein [Aphelenchoides besseyi]